MLSLSSISNEESVGKAFSKQSIAYDADDAENLILQDMRKQVYDHVAKYIQPNSNLLELNAGTGIDALHFVQQGHRVHATDISAGMIRQIEKKIRVHPSDNRFTCQQLSYDQLNQLKGNTYDFVFSNFGGLNCIDDLSKVTRHLPDILKPNSYITFVIMPPVCLWELLWIFKGHGKQAFRRLNKDGVMAHLEGEYFKTYYFSLSQIKKAFGPKFQFITSEALCALSPPPSKVNFPEEHPTLYKSLRRADAAVRLYFPFNRWADHIIVTFQLKEV